MDLRRRHRLCRWRSAHGCCLPSIFFFTDTATTEIYPLSLHDALPILPGSRRGLQEDHLAFGLLAAEQGSQRDRKSTRLNSSHVSISYAVFCVQKKKYRITTTTTPKKTKLTIRMRGATLVW